MTDLLYYNFLEKLEKQIGEILKTKERVLISVVGKGGTGKSFFGKYLRNNGCGKFNKRIVSVIDDGIMWREILFFFRKRMKISCNGIDEIKPFLEKLPRRKKIIFYINATPWKRISEADILLKLSTNEDIRKKRLYQRYSNKSETLKKALNSEEIADYKIKYKYLLKAKI